MAAIQTEAHIGVTRRSRGVKVSWLSPQRSALGHTFVRVGVTMTRSRSTGTSRLNMLSRTMDLLSGTGEKAVLRLCYRYKKRAESQVQKFFTASHAPLVECRGRRRPEAALLRVADHTPEASRIHPRKPSGAGNPGEALKWSSRTNESGSQELRASCTLVCCHRQGNACVCGLERPAHGM